MEHKLSRASVRTSSPTRAAGDLTARPANNHASIELRTPAGNLHSITVTTAPDTRDAVLDAVQAGHVPVSPSGVAQESLSSRAQRVHMLSTWLSLSEDEAAELVETDGLLAAFDHLLGGDEPLLVVQDGTLWLAPGKTLDAFSLVQANLCYCALLTWARSDAANSLDRVCLVATGAEPSDADEGVDLFSGDEAAILAGLSRIDAPVPVDFVVQVVVSAARLEAANCRQLLHWIGRQLLQLNADPGASAEEVSELALFYAALAIRDDIAGDTSGATLGSCIASLQEIAGAGTEASQSVADLLTLIDLINQTRHVQADLKPDRKRPDVRLVEIAESLGGYLIPHPAWALVLHQALGAWTQAVASCPFVSSASGALMELYQLGPIIADADLLGPQELTLPLPFTSWRDGLRPLLEKRFRAFYVATVPELLVITWLHGKAKTPPAESPARAVAVVADLVADFVLSSDNLDKHLAVIQSASPSLLSDQRPLWRSFNARVLLRLSVGCVGRGLDKPLATIVKLLETALHGDPVLDRNAFSETLQSLAQLPQGVFADASALAERLQARMKELPAANDKEFK